MEALQKKLKTLLNLRLIIAAVIILVILVAGGYYTTQKSKTSVNKISTTNAIVESYKAQLPNLAKASEKNPNNPSARRDYAVALYATGDLQKAYEQYQQAVKLNGSDPILYNNLANVARDLGKYDEAINAYEKAISLNPKAVNPYFNLANLYIFTLGKAELGIEVYENALEENSGNVDLQIQLGIAYEQADDKVKAADAYNEVLKTSPNSPAALAGLQRLNQKPSATSTSPATNVSSSPKPSVSTTPRPTSTNDE